ncbi:MAG: hypothetical protein ABR987_22075 [Terracidiphilus sp.]|jgi:hypothetical protein
MEFSYRITEAEYLQASKLKPLRSFAFLVFKVVGGIIFFWFCAFVGLILLWALVQRSGAVALQPAAKQAGAGQVLKGIVLNLGPFFAPFIVIGGAGIYLLFGLESTLRRREYRKDPRMLGEFTANITQNTILVRDASGAPSQGGGDRYEGWHESKGMIVLRLRSGGHSIVSLTGLPEPQRGELRGLLTATLPRR